MRKLKLTFIGLFMASACCAQAGINTPNPKVTLDIVAVKTDPSTAEGMLVPRLTGDQIKGKDNRYGIDQVGTIVFATKAVTLSSPKTQYITVPCLYFFDGSAWKPIACNTTSTPTPSVTLLNCDSATHSGTLLMGA